MSLCGKEGYRGEICVEKKIVVVSFEEFCALEDEKSCEDVQGFRLELCQLKVL